MEFREDEVRTFEKRALCSCGAELVYDAMTMHGGIARFNYRCPECSMRYSLGDRYPLVVYKPIEDKE